jgi:hypothetical protein
VSVVPPAKSARASLEGAKVQARAPFSLVDAYTTAEFLWVNRAKWTPYFFEKSCFVCLSQRKRQLSRSQCFSLDTGSLPGSAVEEL